MKWAFKLARIAGIDVYIHYTFFLLVAWFAWRGYGESGLLIDAINGVIFICALFTCVVLHEFGHALTGRKFGVRTSHITLLPFGGIASMEAIPKQPKQEILISLAGPAVNVAIAGIIYVYLQLVPAQISQEQMSQGDWPFLVQLLYVNLFLAVFNLIPAFPMDGGRVLRGLLAIKLEYSTATLWASRVGKFFAAAFVAYGVASGNTMLIIIGVFIFMGATSENRVVQFNDKVKLISIENIATKNYHYLDDNQTFYAAKQLLENYAEQQVFPVGTAAHLHSFVSGEKLLKAMQAINQDELARYTVDDIAKMMGSILEPVKTVQADLSINEVVELVGAQPAKLIAVEKEGRVVGILTIQRLLQIAEI
ncbi:MAG: site-2 protease family protein [Sinobacterium sp.]|nr:site-2 protease family protein [Sinobacterium sp.]